MEAIGVGMVIAQQNIQVSSITFFKKIMKTFLVKVLQDADQGAVTAMLKKMAAEKTIEFEETSLDFNEPEPATDDQVQEIIDEAELGPYYSEKEAKDILNL